MARTCIFLPPLRAVSGGLAVLAEVASGLAGLGQDVALVLRDPSAPPLRLPHGLPAVALDAAGLTPDDVYVVPEGWPNALAPGLAAGARCRRCAGCPP